MASESNDWQYSVQYLKFQEYRHYTKRAADAAGAVQEPPMDTFIREIQASKAAQADVSGIEHHISEDSALVIEPSALEGLIFRAIIARYPNDDDVTYFEPDGMALVDSTQCCASKDMCQLLCRFISVEGIIALSKTCNAWWRILSSTMDNTGFVKSLYMAKFFQLPPKYQPKAPMTWCHLYLYQNACERAPPKSVLKWVFFRKRCRLGGRSMVFRTPNNVEEAQKLWAQLADKPCAKSTKASKAN